MAWFDDLNLPGSTVTGHFAFVREDGPDVDDAPDLQLASGTVRFEPTAKAVRAGGAWVGIAPVTAVVFDGELVVSEEDPRPLRLLSTDAATGVEGWGWEATFNIDGASIKPIRFHAPAEGVHLTGDDLIPITGLPVEVIHGGAVTASSITDASTVGRAVLTAPLSVDARNALSIFTGTRALLDAGTDTAERTWDAAELSSYVTDKVAEAGGASSWDDLTDKPSTFPPSAHTHGVSDVSGLQALLDLIGKDTGARNLNAAVPNRISGDVILQRVGPFVYLTINELLVTPNNGASTWTAGGFLPAGFRFPAPAYRYFSSFARTVNHNSGDMRVDQYGGMAIYNTNGLATNVTASWITNQAFPTTLPGVPA